MRGGSADKSTDPPPIRQLQPRRKREGPILSCAPPPVLPPAAPTPRDEGRCRHTPRPQQHHRSPLRPRPRRAAERTTVKTLSGPVDDPTPAVRVLAQAANERRFPTNAPTTWPMFPPASRVVLQQFVSVQRKNPHRPPHPAQGDGPTPDTACCVSSRLQRRSVVTNCSNPCYRFPTRRNEGSGRLIGVSTNSASHPSSRLIAELHLPRRPKAPPEPTRGSHPPQTQAGGRSDLGGEPPQPTTTIHSVKQRSRARLPVGVTRLSVLPPTRPLAGASTCITEKMTPSHWSHRVA